jgi:radical SAM protein with 4Fe4S-binding SPASM domain
MCPMSQRKQPSLDSKLYPQLSPSLVKNLLAQGQIAGQASLGFGGLWEPLLSPNIAELVAYARTKGIIEAMFNTNGLLLTNETSKDLIEAGLTRIMISLDAATEPVYKLMRPGSDFKTVCDNILQLLALRKQASLKLPLVRLSFCLTSLNESELPQFINQWEGKVDFFSLQCYGRYHKEAPSLFSAGKYAAAPSGKCAQPFKRLMVRHNGQVLPCCDLSGVELNLGSVYENSLKQIWEGEPLRKVRKSLLGNKEELSQPCQKCQSKYQP